MNRLYDISEAESELTDVEGLIDRLQLRAHSQGGLTLKQLEIVSFCKEQLESALKARTVPTAGGIKTSNSEDHPWYLAANALIDGRSNDLEEAIKSLPLQDYQDVEFIAVKLLKQQQPVWAWQRHQRKVARRVLERLEKSKIFYELIELPNKVIIAFEDEKDFKEGEKYIPGKRHQYTSREKVLVKGGKGARKYGFVCRETEKTVFLIDKNGIKFRKKKGNVMKTKKREKIIDRKIAEISF